jgi:Spy/CpxP family protein refolding chaperone
MEVSMRYNLRLNLLACLILALTLLPYRAALAQPGHGGGMMGAQKGGMMHSCGMMGGMGGGMMHGGLAAGMLMQGYHGWLGRLMAQAADVGLTGDQLAKIDQMITAHKIQAVRNQAEMQVNQINLKQNLRADTIDLKKVEKQLRDLHNQAIALELAGVRLHTEIMNLLSPQQKEKIQQKIGGPFPPAWDKHYGSMMCPPAAEMHKEKAKTDGPSDHRHPQP